MKQIWAPWRSVYIGGNHGGKCFFCEKLESDRDEDNLVLLRGNSAFVIMNLYPYNNGHLLIAPNRHTGEIEDLTGEEMMEIFKMTQKMIKALRSFNPEGFNVGANVGRVAGAGVPGHFHVHVVPRWSGDTNFMPVLGNVKVVSESLEITYKKLKEALEKLAEKK
ncbi:diadenosine tetraphosphate hydrolase and other HIT family hydrolases [Pelotomaculum thermopropionicum SI]|uniref:Diadenosine tetraphosphate hydrolase and other HIT family hydrolases n=1 Tax=Pelotomaculum thermopropionicum (strain DSM 13744 / JCM 10971 / SI) TaxID=370438 RepID=A5D470_PELTS|nr:diadenosine tetraphosphate hydrolase and other HIT family hydrolases [Pelotomaculum thermopropionicum SI]